MTHQKVHDKLRRHGGAYIKDFFPTDSYDEALLLSDRLSKGYGPSWIYESDRCTLRSVFDVHHVCPELLKLFLGKPLVDLVETALGGDSYIYQSHLNYKMPLHGEEYEWHSDFTFWRDQDGMESPNAVSVVIPLERHTAINGGLKYIKGSHTHFYESSLTMEEWSTESVKHHNQENRLSRGLVGQSELAQFSQQDINQLSMSPGDVFVMSANTWHASAGNLSKHSRRTLFIIFNAIDNTPEVPSHGGRPNYITCRERVRPSDL